MNANVKLLLILAFLGLRNIGFAQSSYIATDEDSYHLISRYRLSHPEMYSDATSIRPFYRADLTNLLYAPKHLTHRKDLSHSDRFNYGFLYDDNWDELPFDTAIRSIYLHAGRKRKARPFDLFYEYRNAFFSVDEKDFRLIVNPVFDLKYGKDMTDDQVVYRNTRGLELRGSIDNKVGFYTFMSENQYRYPNAYDAWVDDYRAVPGAGFLKSFGAGARDFLVARGYITVSPAKQISVQFGHDRNFIGNGYRSLILSDFAKENLFLKFTTKVWRIQYMNLFSEYTDRSSSVQGKKYGALHYLNLNILPGKLDIGVFEHILFVRNNSGYEANYLNPIIFYRTVEHGLNSTDNAVLGMDFRLIPVKKLMFYGQFVLDEFHKDELVNRTHSWVNKWAAQLGGLWIDVAGIRNLDWRVETNLVRPYTYTHLLPSQAYTQYNQSLAHPIGSNFKEVLTVLKYQPLPRLTLTAKYFHIIHGADSTFSEQTTHFGGNLLSSYENRPKDSGIFIGDGVKETIGLIDVALSFQIKHRTFFDLRYINRDNKRDQPLVSDRVHMVSFGFRMNIDRQNFDF
ncbi:MAG: hypothetical protein KDC76_09200 [Bacteroidetes bacterium]|nr:hypothetical protein [Bacteroidota bacterium]